VETKPTQREFPVLLGVRTASGPERESTATEEVYLYCDIADEYASGHVIQADVMVLTETF